MFGFYLETFFLTQTGKFELYKSYIKATEYIHRKKKFSIGEDIPKLRPSCVGIENYTCLHMFESPYIQNF
jgi:hypothetical protein